MDDIRQSVLVAGEGQEVEDLKAFLVRFEEFKQQQIQTLRPVQDFLNRFTAGRDRLIKQEQEWEATVAPRFNVFQALRIERRETKLHSQFLAELLDPRGCHCQRDYFLKLFLTNVPELRRPDPWPGPSGWEVTTEDAVEQGDRLDIVLRCRMRGFITVFENKVDALEQEDQMDRYAVWLDKQKKKFPDQNLIFLTPDGRAPNTDTHNRSVRLSYREDIHEWLTSALQNIRAIPLRCALEQYLRVVENL